jgi:hypothetical protein
LMGVGWCGWVLVCLEGDGDVTGQEERQLTHVHPGTHSGHSADTPRTAATRAHLSLPVKNLRNFFFSSSDSSFLTIW